MACFCFRSHLTHLRLDVYRQRRLALDGLVDFRFERLQTGREGSRAAGGRARLLFLGRTSFFAFMLGRHFGGDFEMRFNG